MAESDSNVDDIFGGNVIFDENAAEELLRENGLLPPVPAPAPAPASVPAPVLAPAPAIVAPDEPVASGNQVNIAAEAEDDLLPTITIAQTKDALKALKFTLVQESPEEELTPSENQSNNPSSTYEIFEPVEEEPSTSSSQPPIVLRLKRRNSGVQKAPIDDHSCPKQFKKKGDEGTAAAAMTEEDDVPSTSQITEQYFNITRDSIQGEEASIRGVFARVDELMKNFGDKMPESDESRESNEELHGSHEETPLQSDVTNELNSNEQVVAGPSTANPQFPIPSDPSLKDLNPQRQGHTGPRIGLLNPHQSNPGPRTRHLNPRYRGK